MVNRCIQHSYSDIHEKVDWISLREELRAHLETKVDSIVDKFDIVSCKKLNSKGEETIDPTMYIGSGGVCLSLFRYIKLLKRETPQGKENQRLNDIEKKLDNAMIKNIEAADKVTMERSS